MNEHFECEDRAIHDQSRETIEVADEKIGGDERVTPTSVRGEYVPQINVKNDLPLADEIGVVGTWPVVSDRPQL